MDPWVREALYPGASLMGDEEVEAVTRVMRSRSLFRYYGPQQPEEVALYEHEWAEHIGVRHALAVNSGTSALFCALVACGVQRGDEVIVPAFAWASVPNAVIQVGAVPVVVNIDRGLTLDPRAVEDAIGPKTRAILPVHMRGAPCAIDEIAAVATAAGIPIVEDACQAAGVTYRGRPAGSFGLVAAFSTQFAKLISTGEGGAVLTDDDACHRAALDAHDPANALRRGEEPSAYPGLNLRCTEIQAAIGRVQLRRVSELVEVTRGHSARIVETVEQIPAFTLRHRHDAVGANGIAVIFFCASGDAARGVRDALRSDGVAALTLHEPGIPDLHVAESWRPVDALVAEMGLRPPNCRASFDLLASAVQIDVHPLYHDDHVAAICAALERAGAHS